MTDSLAASWFRWISRAEGLSLLVLFGFAMPLKYVFGDPTAVHWVGWVHGILFLVYVIALAGAAYVGSWPWMRVAMGLVASMVPFGPFVFERYVDRPTATAPRSGTVG